MLPKRFPDRDEIAAVREDCEALDAGTESAEKRRLAGRVLGRRGHGKLVFLDLVDRSGRIQLLCDESRTGELDLDLGDIALTSGTTTTVEASVGIGSLVITVPDGVALEIDAEAGIGEVDVLGSTDDGVDANQSMSVAGPTPDAPVLEIEADVGLGGVEVVRG